MEKKGKFKEIDIDNLVKLGPFYLIERNKSFLDIESQVKVIERWLIRAEDQKDAVRLILANFDELIKRKRSFYHFVRSCCGDHIFNNDRRASKFAAIYLGKYFDRISPLDRVQLIEILIQSRNPKTDKAIRKLFHAKFNYLPINFRNRLLRILITAKDVPEYYLQSFLLDKKEDVSVENKTLIKNRLTVIAANKG